MTRNPIVAGTVSVPSRRALLGSGSALLGLGAASGTAAAETNPDAEFIAMCEQHIENMRAYNAREDTPPHGEPDPLEAAYYRTWDAISQTRATTLAGLVALARVMKMEGTNPDGTPNPDLIPTGWAMGLADELIAFAGSAAA